MKRLPGSLRRCGRKGQGESEPVRDLEKKRRGRREGYDFSEESQEGKELRNERREWRRVVQHKGQRSSEGERGGGGGSGGRARPEKRLEMFDLAHQNNESGQMPAGS
eukprot:758388-Hanusia_phi.AAC.9